MTDTKFIISRIKEGGNLSQLCVREIILFVIWLQRLKISKLIPVLAWCSEFILSEVIAFLVLIYKM